MRTTDSSHGDDTEILSILDEMTTSTGEARRRLEDEVARRCLPFARSIALRYVHRGAELDDLVAVANCGLAKAIRQFRPERGSFFAYAASTIHGDIKKYFRDHCWSVRPPRRIQELQARIATETDEQPHPLSRSQLAARLHVGRHDVEEAMALSGVFTAASLDRVTGSGPALMETLGELQPEFVLIDEAVSVGDACRTLGDDDRELLRLRFVEERTQSEIARMLGVSQMQVSRRLRSVLDQLRALVEQPTAA